MSKSNIFVTSHLGTLLFKRIFNSKCPCYQLYHGYVLLADNRGDKSLVEVAKDLQYLTCVVKVRYHKARLSQTNARLLFIYEIVKESPVKGSSV